MDRLNTNASYEVANRCRTRCWDSNARDCESMLLIEGVEMRGIVREVAGLVRWCRGSVGGRWDRE